MALNSGWMASAGCYPSRGGRPLFIGLVGACIYTSIPSRFPIDIPHLLTSSPPLPLALPLPLPLVHQKSSLVVSFYSVSIQFPAEIKSLLASCCNIANFSLFLSLSPSLNVQLCSIIRLWFESEIDSIWCRPISCSFSNFLTSKLEPGRNEYFFIIVVDWFNHF